MADTTIQPLGYFLRNVGIIWHWIFADEALTDALGNSMRSECDPNLRASRRQRQRPVGDFICGKRKLSLKFVTATSWYYSVNKPQHLMTTLLVSQMHVYCPM